MIKQKNICNLCPHNCHIQLNKTGICGVRRFDGQQVISATYGKVSGMAFDPIEKKPLCRFYPGSNILSIGSFGCNLSCPFCQNYRIAKEFGQYPYEIYKPTEIADLALQAKSRGNIGVAYTYNEPLVGYEFVLDCAKEVKKLGLQNVLVTNGYLNQEPLLKLLPHIDAMNIDLKGFRQDFYKKLGGSLEPVLHFIETAAESCHVELTCLIIPDENDSIEEMKEMTTWIASLNPEIPLHISRFFPQYRYAHKAITPREHILKLAQIAREKLKYVYLGNC